MIVRFHSALISTYCPFKSLTILERERGGLLVLDETNLLSTVEQKAESVLLFKNLKSYTQKNAIKLPIHDWLLCCVHLPWWEGESTGWYFSC